MTQSEVTLHPTAVWLSVLMEFPAGAMANFGLNQRIGTRLLYLTTGTVTLDTFGRHMRTLVRICVAPGA